jgi:UDP-N-acetylglucosamine 2-epimerase (non-hydrolysing)
MPEPDVYLGVGSDTHARQTARVMTAFEEVCQERKPGLVIVGGDVNSTLAAALVAAKQHIPVGHVEAGLRSFDRAMPEEINRICADHLSELLFTTEKSGDENLKKEGVSREKIHFVGNCMVDTLLKHVDTAVKTSPWKQFGLEPGHYGLLTLHRPSNVDDPKTLKSIVKAIGKASGDIPILFPVHPRTRERLHQLKLKIASSARLCDPLPYLSFVGLMARAKYVLTDSGGIQEESTVLNVPCLTLRWNTERPITVTKGTNKLVGTDAEKIEKGVEEILAGKWRRGRRPPLWDGRAAVRIVDIIQERCLLSPQSR